MLKRKRTLKEQYGTLEHFLNGDCACRFIGDRYIQGTNIYDRREWRGVRDTAYCFGWWLATWAKTAGLAARDPARVMAALRRYRSMSCLLTAPHWMDACISGDRGCALRCDMQAVNAVLDDAIDTLWKEIRADRKLGETKRTAEAIPFDCAVPLHIAYGFPGYEGISIGLPSMALASAAPAGEYPDAGNCAVCCGRPGSAMTNDAQKPARAFTPSPMPDDPTTREYTVHEIYETIKFLERHTGQKFDWDAFRACIEAANQLAREERARWEISAEGGCGCLNGACQTFYGLYGYVLGAGSRFTSASKKMLEIFKSCASTGQTAFPNTRHRALAWGVGGWAFGSVWLYNCWGVTTVMSMASLAGHNLVDVSDRDTMIDDLADWYTRVPMLGYAAGGVVPLAQMWETAEKFNCDMIILCTDADAAATIPALTPECRGGQIHIMCVPGKPAQFRKAANEFMTAVMGEAPIDPSLADFDDSMGWQPGCRGAFKPRKERS